MNHEIREFAALGREGKVLPLLIEGEPEEAFPPALVQSGRIPLAADVRVGNRTTRNEALFRIIAPLVGCTYDELRRRERLRIRRRIQLVASCIAASVLLLLSIRYGVLRLSLQNASIGTYYLVVKRGLDSIQPLLGSDQAYIEASDKLYELSPRGRGAFVKSSIYFPAFDQDVLFRWLNKYYFEELRQSPNKKAPVSDFFLEQIRLGDQPSISELLNALNIGAPVAMDVAVAHRLSGEKVRNALSKALSDSDAKTKALSLNALHDLYGDDLRNRISTQAVLGACDAGAVKTAMALAYDPDLASLNACVSKLVREKKWKDASSLIVRFQLLHENPLPWLRAALVSVHSDEFLAAADIVMGTNLKDPTVTALLKKRLSDAEERIRTGAALALWGLGLDGDLVRKLVRGTVSGQRDPSSTYCLALLRSPLSDDQIPQCLEKQLGGVGAGDFTDGWLVARPDAFDVLAALKNKGAAEICLYGERRTRSEDYAQAVLTARAAMLGCRDESVLRVLDSYVATGVPGLLGVMMDPRISEAYGSVLVRGQPTNFGNSLERLWGLLRSHRSESSANYRLAVEYGIADLVVGASSDSEFQKRLTATRQLLSIWENDVAPHHRATFAHVFRLIREKRDRRRLLPLRTEFCTRQNVVVPGASS